MFCLFLFFSPRSFMFLPPLKNMPVDEMAVVNELLSHLGCIPVFPGKALNPLQPWPGLSTYWRWTNEYGEVQFVVIGIEKFWSYLLDNPSDANKYQVNKFHCFAIRWYHWIIYYIAKSFASPLLKMSASKQSCLWGFYDLIGFFLNFCSNLHCVFTTGDRCCCRNATKII